MAHTSASDVSTAIETVVSSMTTQVLIQESVMMGAVRDFSSDVRPGMDQVDINLFTELAVQDVLENGTEMTPQTINPSAASLALDRNKAIPFAISKRAGVQSKINLVQEAVFNGARSLAAEMDDYMIGLLDAGASTAAPDHRLALTADELADVRNAKQLLDVQNVPRSDRFIVASPGWIANLLGNNNVIRVNEYGSATGIQAGFVSDLYGFRILESSSSSIVDDGFIAFHRDTIAFARQMAMGLDQEERALKQTTDYALVHLYGGILTDSSGVRVVVYDADGA